jgi:biopolymer transport protein ExbB/TolQ
MDAITKILYWISTGLLIPVIVLLLMFFIKSLILIGTFYGMYIQKLKFNKHFRDTLSRLNYENVHSELDIPEKDQKLPIVIYLNELQNIEKTEVFVNKVLNDFEHACKKDLSKSQTIAKLGPILGLMGTLIPMGPALVGLAAGDIASMASNMQVAFSTTVIGLFTGAIGYVIQQIKKRWYTYDVQNLEFIGELLVGEEVGKGGKLAVRKKG